MMNKTKDSENILREESQQKAGQTPTTIFSDRPITASEQYCKVVNPERQKLLIVLAIHVIFVPLIFRYACGSAANIDVDTKSIEWASGIDNWEWAVLVVLWLGALGSIFRLLPMICGRPSSLEAGQVCNLDGVASLGLCSPFCSEDDAILLRSMIGRTCTVLHTVGSRHSLQGFYMDTILNERRIKGEANRRNLWISWMKFLNSLVEVCKSMKEEQNKKEKDPKYDNNLRNFSVDSIISSRALYIDGICQHNHVASTPRVRTMTAESVGINPSPRKTTFKDLSAVFDSTQGITPTQRAHLHAWSRDYNDINRSLSNTIGQVSPRFILPSATAAAAQHKPPLRTLSSPTRPIASNTIDHTLQLNQIQETANEEDEDEDDQMTNDETLRNFYNPWTQQRELTQAGMRRMDSVDEGIESPHSIKDQDFPINNGGITSFEIVDNLRDLINSTSSHSMRSIRSTLSRDDSNHRIRYAPGVSLAAQCGIGGLIVNTQLSSEKLQHTNNEVPSNQRKANSTVQFTIAPTPRAAKVNPRQAAAIGSYRHPHSIPDLDLNMADIVPMIDFLDSWLEEMQENEWTYNYHDPKSALEKLFFASPFMSHFRGQHMLAVHAALDALYDAFTTTLPNEADPKRPYHPDDISEVKWVLRRENLPDWTVLWSYASRARLREIPRDHIQDPHGPDAVYQSTRIKPGAIVYQLPSDEIPASYAPTAYFQARQKMFKVDYIRQDSTAPGVKLAYLLPYGSHPDAPTGTTNTSLPDPEAGLSTTATDTTNTTTDKANIDNSALHTIVPLHELVLIEMNRGKTGALNFFNDYLRAKTFQWRSSLEMNHPVQTFTGIVDARHALVETDVFWNDALPYFSIVEGSGEPGKRFGSLNAHSICITVQYPQFFSNISPVDDVLDNSNSTYYNLWQTLRDGAKCICSSGTNAIWDISNPDFEFCTESRSEDLGTSHEHIPHSAAVYLCVNVALGIAKQTEDFLEALYRWSAGPLELLWPSFFRPKILKQYIHAGIPTAMLAMASFYENPLWLYGYYAMLLLLCIKGVIDQRAGRKPLRSLAVATVISINLFIVCSNLMSIMWFVVFPCRIAFYGILPMGRTDQQGLFWGWISLFISLPTGVMHDSLIRIARHTAPATKEMNYNQCLWRGGQLYANSFMFTAMATIAGSYSAFKAWMYDYDLSMWSSFRISNSEFDKIYSTMKSDSCFSCSYYYHIWQYIVLYCNSCLAAMTMPTVMTKWYVTCIFIFQFICIGISTFYVNRDNLLNICVVVLMCTFNILMTVEVALLLQPAFKYPFGFPCRAEYIFGIVGLLIIISGIINGALTINTISSRVRMEL